MTHEFFMNLFFRILLVATLCKSGRAERVYIHVHSCLKIILDNSRLIRGNSCSKKLLSIDVPVVDGL